MGNETGLSERPEPPEETDAGWNEWKEDNFAMHPWTQEIHRLGVHCDCDRHGQPSKGITPEQACGLLNTDGITTGDCVVGVADEDGKELLY